VNKNELNTNKNINIVNTTNNPLGKKKEIEKENRESRENRENEKSGKSGKTRANLKEAKIKAKKNS
jgi:hypothetical protein